MDLVKIVPFNDFWINCTLNARFSCAISLEPTYRKAAYVNSYGYEEKNIYIGNDFKFMDTSYFDDYDIDRKGDILKIKPYSFRNSGSVLEEINELLLSGPVLLYVDLYNFLPGSFTWHRFHWCHYTNIIGYNKETEKYNVLEEDFGYGIREIPAERMLLAFNNSDHFIDYGKNIIKSEMEALCYKVRLNDNKLEPYIFDLKQILSNALRLQEHLRGINVGGLWNFDENYNLYDSLAYAESGIYRVVNRQIGNRFLLEKLFKEKVISGHMYNLLNSDINNLIEGWNLIKNTVIKKQVAKYDPAIIPVIQSKAGELIGGEIDYWNRFSNSFSAVL